jgi:organic hydroperoxide reductase OsmC/OhrA
MQPFPHHYRVDATAPAIGSVIVSAAGVPTLSAAPPAEFGGPGDQWSPETLFVGAAVSCFILTFRAVAQASQFDWRELTCRGEGILDRVDGTTRFKGLSLHAQLVVPPNVDHERGKRLLTKAEHGCLITNSLAFAPTLVCSVTTA